MILVATNEVARGKIYNLGGPEVIGLKSLADLIIDLGYGGRYELISFPEERKKIDIGDYYGDYSLITSEIGWKPGTDLREGLNKTLS